MMDCCGQTARSWHKDGHARHVKVKVACVDAAARETWRGREYAVNISETLPTLLTTRLGCGQQLLQERT